jgi:hypothetical protein
MAVDIVGIADTFNFINHTQANLKLNELDFVA